MGQTGILQTIANEFMKRFKFDTSSNLELAIPLSIDLKEADNDMFDNGCLNEEILEAGKQVTPFKAHGPIVFKLFFFIKSLNISAMSICNIVRSFFNHGHVVKKLF